MTKLTVPAGKLEDLGSGVVKVTVDASGGGGIVAAVYGDATGGYTDQSGGSIISLTHTFDAGTYLFIVTAEMERRSGTHAQLHFSLDSSTRIWPANPSTEYDINDRAADSLDGNVYYHINYHVIRTLTAASHTLELYDDNSAPFRYFQRAIVAFQLA